LTDSFNVSRLNIVRADDGARLWTVDVATSWFARLRGLIGRASLPAGDGLYFPGTNGVHMLFMRFAVDCVFLGEPHADGTRQVVAVRRNLRPWTGVVWHVRAARGVIELNGNSAEAAGVCVGDMVRLVPAGQG
jgi:hypothetical protein